MKEVESLVTKAMALDSDIAQRDEAFSQLVTLFQDMAYGCAYAILGDFHLAQDAAQETFISAYVNLSKLQNPKAFPGWLRQIVIRRCNRMTRRKNPSLEPIEAALDMPSTDPDPEAVAEKQEMKDKVMEAIKALPEKERMVTTLFYINGYSQNEVADFLEISTTVVNNRLRSSRNRLKERMIDMVQDDLKEKRPSKDDQFVKKVLEAGEVSGFLHLVDVYGFLRPTADAFSSPEDIYVSPSQLQRFNLKKGDFIIGLSRPPRPSREHYLALLKIERINDNPAVYPELEAKPQNK